ncbi:MAG: hypothetical protein ACFB51_19030 [Anaerolineae bacterium]
MKRLILLWAVIALAACWTTIDAAGQKGWQRHDLQTLGVRLDTPPGWQRVDSGRTVIFGDDVRPDQVTVAAESDAPTTGADDMLEWLANQAERREGDFTAEGVIRDGVVGERITGVAGECVSYYFPVGGSVGVVRLTFAPELCDDPALIEAIIGSLRFAE